MELVDGEDLSQQVARGPLPLSDALAIARHRRGARGGAGFRAREGDGSRVREQDASPSDSPTLTARATQLGMVLGTAAYMSPEQARGRAVDKRTDVWAFGCVLYEMLTGRRAFGGEDATEIISAVMKSEPDWAALPASVPAHVRAIIERCLLKDRQALREGGPHSPPVSDSRFTEHSGKANESMILSAQAPPERWFAR